MKKRQSTKEKLLYILKKDQTRTIRELMVYFTISEIAVRKHLNELERQGFIQSEVVKQKIGRPYHTYQLTDRGHQTFPNQYETLPLELLADLEVLQGKQGVYDLLNKRMIREQASFLKEVKHYNFDEKVAEIAKIQDEKGYMIEYDKQEDGSYEMINFNCPIINIASAYKQICLNEKKMLGNVFTDSVVASETCITNGDHFCKWTISKP